MSEKFLRIARKEIQEELDGLQRILAQCSNDTDISNNAKSIERHLHKIKGLAPMMGQKEVGEIARMNDAILKHVISNGILDGTFKIISEANLIMKKVFDGDGTKNVEEFKKNIKQTFPDLINY